MSMSAKQIITPHEHQMQFIDQIREQYKGGSKSVLGVAPVAFGKTVVSSYIAKSAQDKGSRVIFTVHRDNLVHQTSATFKDFGIDHGFITASEKYDTRKTVHIASIQTLARRTGIILPPDLLVVDECHLAKAKTWQDVIVWAKNNGSRILGNSGSPSRLDGKPLGDLFDSMVESVPMSWLIDQGFLSSYRYFAPTTPDMTGVKKTMGDFSDSDTVEVMDTPKITGDAVTHWIKHARGMRTICFCVTIAHAEHTAQSFKQAGITAAVVSAKTPTHERKKMFIDLADGRLQVLCNVELVTTGFDLSAQAGRDVPVECVIMLRPTQSLALYIQMVGRALRRKPYPAVILDHAGNSSRHGLPDDERVWSLDGKDAKRGKSESNAPATCSGCFNQVRKPTPALCPYCGEPMRTESKPKEITQDADAELIEVSRQEKRRELLKEAGKARTVDELTELGKARGYRYPAQWATKVFNGRMR